MNKTILALASSLSIAASLASAEEFPVHMTVNAGKSLGELRPIWRFFGADEPNYTYMPNGSKLLGELGKLKSGDVFFRTHNLLTTGDGTPALKWGSTNAYTEDSEGRPVYDWTIVDRILDAGLQRGVRPYVQIGFMPKALSSKPEPYQHHWTPKAKYEEIYTGWTYPPKDFAKWEELVFQWARHCVEKYGKEEVLRWYWQTWNEPNLPYWRGTREEFFKTHDLAIRAVRRAIPEARVGGPDVAGGPGGDFLGAFLKHCAEAGTPTDFISFHAKGRPEYVNGHVRMGISAHLKDIDRAFRLIASFPQFKNTPIVIGESEREGCSACQGPQLGYRNGTMYSSYTAASFARKHDLAALHGVNLDGALTWAFTFEGQPLFAGFRQLASGGIDLPVLNVFRMFSKMSGERLDVQSDFAIPLDVIMKSGAREKPDVAAFASREGNKLCILTWHYHEDDVAGPDASVELNLEGLPAEVRSGRIERFQIDATHSNAYEVWKKMGSPTELTVEQRAELERAGKLAKLDSEPDLQILAGKGTLRFTLPRQAVSLHVVQLTP